MPIHLLTVREITALQPGQALTDGGPRGSGALWFKCSRAGTISAVFRYSAGGKVRDWSLGIFDPAGRYGINLTKARARAAELSRLIQSGIPDPRAYLEEQTRQAEEAQAATREAAQRAEEERQRHTLRALIDVYAAHLERLGKGKSATDVRHIVARNVFATRPDLADTPAADIDKTTLAALIRAIREAGRERTAGKLRSWLYAAYNLALRAEGDTAAPAALIPFKIAANPVAGIKAIPVKAGTRALSRAELRDLLARLDDTLMVDQAIRLCLYAGGQRGEQLLRAKVSDFVPATGILRLLDAKGRRTQPREHHLPLGPIAASIVKDMVMQARAERPEDPDPPLFGVVTADAISKRVGRLAKAMAGPAFSFRDLRRSVETELAALGIPSDVRAQLLSHGLSGVQAKHYDKHGYMDEKASALARWERHLSGKEPAKVVKLRARG